jgi:dTDP-4-amino-4,6-dideoxygalactose transaminase
VGPGDEVITTPFSFFATASTITRTGARPVFVDVDPLTLNIDPASIEERITKTRSSRLKAILPVHLYGQCVDMDELARIGTEYKLTIIEDAAQAFGSSWRGKRAGNIGLAAAFSFYPTKNLSCLGDGGLVTTNDPKLAEHVRLLRNHGSSKRYYHEEIGWNSRLDAIQAAILRVKMNYIEDWNAKRKQRADAYDLMLKSSGLLAPAGPAAKLQAPVRLLKRMSQAFHIFHQYVIRVERRDELRAFLTKKNIGSEVYYPVPLHLQQCFAYLGYAEGDLPESERAAKDVLALPIFPELTSEEQATVVSAIAEFYS